MYTRYVCICTHAGGMSCRVRSRRKIILQKLFIKERKVADRTFMNHWYIFLVRIYALVYYFLF